MTRTIETIDPRSVTANPAQCGELDDDNVASLVSAIRDGSELTPVVVIRERMEIVDGCHRREACIEAGSLLRAVFISLAEYKALKAEGVGDYDFTDELTR